MKIGRYKIIYSFPSNIAYKYQDDVYSIVSQQEIIKCNGILHIVSEYIKQID
jgi:hypothetical protein